VTPGTHDAKQTFSLTLANSAISASYKRSRITPYPRGGLARINAQPSQVGCEVLLIIRSVGLQDPQVVKGAAARTSTGLATTN
jgi:hypothetical protein